MNLVLLGKTGGTHVGGSFRRAARDCDVGVHLCDADRAFDASWLRTALNWHLRGHRPPRLGSFSERVVEVCRGKDPDLLLTTGIAPLRARALGKIGRMDVTRANFLTDDPWNPAHRAPWFFRALRNYDVVFTPRRANEDQLRDLGVRVEYLPFGYDDDLFHAEPISDADRRRLRSEVVFVGGADDDRVPFIRALSQAGIRVAVYGGYWDQYDDLGADVRGLAGPETIRKATRAADVALCLVRRANRDGHVMRSLEIPAIGACMLAEDTDEHRTFFGDHGDKVRYFKTPSEMVEQARWLLGRPAVREELRQRVHRSVVRGAHTYRDRLTTVLDTVFPECEPTARDPSSRRS